MRPQLVLFGVAALAALFLAFLLMRPSVPDEVDPTSYRARPGEIENVSPPRDAVSLEAARTEVERSAVASEVGNAPAATTAASSEPLAILLGRVIDARGAPIEGASLSFHSVGGPWAPGRDVPKRKSGRFEVEGYEETSKSDGSFRIEVVLPTSDWITMRVSAGPMRGRAAHEFGPAGGRNRPRILAGENALGDFALVDAGIVRGVVRGDDGTGLAMAEVRLEGHFPGGMSVNATASEDGAYELANVPVGAWPILAKADGWLSATNPSVEVTAARATDGVNFALERAPSISGQIVDSEGMPIEGVRVWGWPQSSGQGAGGTSSADGRFTIYLPQNEPYDLEVTRQKHVENWGEGQTGAEMYAPGTSDVRIVLARKQTLRFRVVDATSGAPITLYSIVFEDILVEGMYRNRFDRIPAAVEHESGEVEMAISVGKQEIGVVAAGYAPCEARAGADPGTPGLQTLRLVPESALRLRLVHAGAPVEGAMMLLECQREITGGAPLGDLARRKRSMPASGGGSFDVGGLAGAIYQLTIDAPGLARHVREDVAVPAGSTIDLGAIELAPASRIHGRVIVPAGSSAVGLFVRVGFGRERGTRVSDPEGHFTIDGLEPGSHEVWLDRAPPLVMTAKSRKIELAANETADVVFDLAGMGPCRIELTVRAGGRPLAGLSVRWETEGNFAFTPGELLVTNELGVARGTLPGGEEGSLVVDRIGRPAYFRRKIPGGLPAGGSFVESIELSLGEVVIELPSTLTRPTSGAVHLDLTNVEDPNSPYMFRIGTPDHALPTYVGDGGPWTSSTVRITEVPVGAFEARVVAFRLDRDAERTTSAWTATEIYAAPLRSITVEAGKIATIDLRTP